MTDDTLLRHLPAVFHEDSFLGQFLAAFEKVLLGRDDTIEIGYPGLEQTIAAIADYFDPKKTPEDFLDWLASWVALTLRADLPILKQREFIAEIVQLYKNRGTKNNLKHLLEIFIRGEATVTEFNADDLQIDENLQVGVNTYLGGSGPPHFFQVTLSIPRPTPAVFDRTVETAHALIDLEKPAHTYYELIPSFPTIQIGCTSTIGVDTIIGTEIGDTSKCQE